MDLHDRQPSGRPLVVTADESVLDDVLRLCAAVGVTPDVAPDVTGARRLWRAAGCIVVGDDLAEVLSRLDLSRRPGVVVLDRPRSRPDVWQHAVRIGAEAVLSLPVDESALAERLADTLDETGERAVTLAVTGGRGGAGSSILASALALTAGHLGHSTLLVDADPLGGGIDLAVGGESVRGLRWPDLAATSGRVSAPALRSALPTVGGVAVLSWDRGDQLVISATSMQTVLAAGRRGCDVVVVDLPRRIDEAAAEALALATTTLLVVPAEVRAVAAALRVRDQLRPIVSDLRTVLRRQGKGVTSVDSPALQRTLELPVAAVIGTDPRVAADIEDGFGPVRRRRSALRQACAEILADVRATRSAA